MPASRPGAADTQGSAGSASGSADGQGQYGQDGAGAAGAPGTRDQGGPQGPAPEAGSSLEQAGNGAGIGTLDGGPEVYDPDLDALAEEALSQPPINYDEDPAPVRAPAAAPEYSFDDDPAPAHGGQDGGAAPEAQEPTAEPAARQRTGREAAEQPAAPASGREQGETEAGTRTGDSQRQHAETSEQAAREVPPVPQQDYSDAGQHASADADPPPDTIAPGTAVSDVPESVAVTALPAETETVPEPDSGQASADTALIAAPGDDTPVTPAASSDGELPAEQKSPSAERPEDPVASLTTTEALAQEPGTAEPDPDETAQPEDPLAVIASEPGPGGDTDPGETTVVPEAESAQVSTAEHDPQTQDPEPEPETAVPLAETGGPAAGEQSPTGGATSETNSGSADGGGSGPKPPDGPGPGGDTGQQGGSRQPIWHVTSEFHDKKLGMYTDGVNWKPEDVVQDALRNDAKDSQPKAPVRHGIADFPHARDLGDNNVGETPEQSPGDTSDLPPAGAELAEMEPDDKPLRRTEQLGRMLDHEFGDVKDAASNIATTVQDLNDMPAPGGQPGCLATPRGPEISPVPYQAPDVGSIAQLGIVLGVMGWHTARFAGGKMSEMTDRIHEWRDNQHGGNW